MAGRMTRPLPACAGAGLARAGGVILPLMADLLLLTDRCGLGTVPPSQRNGETVGPCRPIEPESRGGGERDGDRSSAVVGRVACRRPGGWSNRSSCPESRSG